MWRYNYTDELYHYGVLGMKWGKRKHSYTSSIRKRKKRSRPMSQDAKEVSAIRKKKISEMSNAELRKANERRNLEKNYKSLNPNAVKKGVVIAATTAAAMGSIVAIKNNGQQIIGMGRDVVNSFSNVQLRLF